MKILLIRHGQTTGDIEDRYGGEYDDHLTEEGKEQSERLAQQLKEYEIKKIFCSPLIRAQETAEILKEELDCETETVPELRERNQYGILTGMVKSDAKEKYPELVELLRDTHNTIEGGESYEDFKQKILAIFDKLTNTSESLVAILTHGGPIRVIFREILNLGEINIGDCAFVELEKAGKLKVIRLGGVNYQ